MFKLAISDKVLFDVKGTLRTESGADQPFDFQLEARRDSHDDVVSNQEDGRPIIEYMTERVTGWRKVAGEDGKPLEFSPEAFGQLMKIAHMPGFVFRAYMVAIGPKGRQGN